MKTYSSTKLFIYLNIGGSLDIGFTKGNLVQDVSSAKMQTTGRELIKKTWVPIA